MYYIFNQDRKFLVSCSGQPDAADIESRGETLIYSNQVFSPNDLDCLTFTDEGVVQIDPEKVEKKEEFIRNMKALALKKIEDK